MPRLKLFHSPEACSQVAMTALEHIGCPYEAHRIDLARGDQKGAEYLAVNPRGKVPALLVEGRLLTENAAILGWLSAAYPEARLLPPPIDEWARAQVQSDLFWISASWHPYARANRLPIRWTTGDTAPVRERGAELMRTCMDQLETRLADARWWYDDWSIIDVYFYWCYKTAEVGQFSLAPYPNVLRHSADIEALPAFERAVARERASVPAQS